MEEVDPSNLVMRLRSSQLVFLMLLVCSVRVGEECAAQLTSAVAGPARLASAERDNSPAYAAPGTSLGSHSDVTPRNELGPAARAAHLAVWAMPAPASASAAITCYTSLLRA